MRRIGIIIFCALFFLNGVLVSAVSLVAQGDDIQKEIEEKRAEVERLEKEIATYRETIAKKQGEEKSFTQAISVLQSRIAKLRLSIQSLRVSLEKVQLQIRVTKRSIADTEKDIAERKAALAASIQLLDQYEEKRTALMFFFNTPRFSDVLDALRDMFLLQQKMYAHITALQELSEKLSKDKATLEEQEEEQAQLLQLQQLQQDETRRKQAEQAELLQKTKAEAKRLKSLVELSKEAIEGLKNDMYALGKIGVAVNDAITLGKLVASRVEVRASFLLAVLEVESRLGLNVGKGTWTKDMNPNQHDAFLQIMQQLGMDADTTPVSKKPSYGWGGAMGPAQFLPKTWMGYVETVARLTGHNPPSPWNLEDAFMAAGVKLSNDGARSKDRAGELRAANVYLSGNPRCTKSICNYYSNLVLDKAGEIEEKLTN